MLEGQNSIEEYLLNIRLILDDFETRNELDALEWAENELYSITQRANTQRRNVQGRLDREDDKWEVWVTLPGDEHKSLRWPDVYTYDDALVRAKDMNENWLYNDKAYYGVRKVVTGD